MWFIRTKPLSWGFVKFSLMQVLVCLTVTSSLEFSPFVQQIYKAISLGGDDIVLSVGLYFLWISDRTLRIWSYHGQPTKNNLTNHLMQLQLFTFTWLTVRLVLFWWCYSRSMFDPAPTCRFPFLKPTKKDRISLSTSGDKSSGSQHFFFSDKPLVSLYPQP